MNWQLLPLLFPLGVIVLLSTALALYIWRRRGSASIAVPLAVALVMMAEWACAYALELAVPDLAGKALWAKAELLGSVGLAVAWFTFAIRYTGYDTRPARGLVAFLLFLCALVVLLIGTNEIHGLVWSKLELQTNNSLPFLRVSHGPGFWIILALDYGLVCIGAFLLFRAQMHYPTLYRAQIAVVLVSFAAPILGNVLSFVDVGPFPLLDLTPFMFILADLAVAWGIARYHMVDISPVARDAIIENMRDGVIIVDTRDRIVELNPAAERIVNYSASQAIGQLAPSALFDRLGLGEDFRRAAEARAEISLDGDPVRHYEAHLSPFFKPPHQVAGRLLVLHEITQRRQIEQALQESEERYRRLVELSPDAIGVQADGWLAFINSAGLKLFGAARTEQLIGRPLDDLFHPACRGTLRQWMSPLAEGRAVPSTELKAVRLDGETVDIEMAATALTYRDRPAVQFVARDITLRKRAEGALRQSEERYRVISELTSDYAYAFRIEPDGQIVLEWMSEALGQATGYTPDQMSNQGEWFLNLSHPDDSQIALEQGLNVLAGQPDVREFRFIARNGEVRWIRNACQPIWNDGRERVVGFWGAAQDITERKRTDAQLERNAQELLGLYHMGQTVLSSLDLDTVLNQVIEELRTLLGASDVSILLLENQDLVFAAVAGASASVLQGQRIPADVGVAGEVVRSGHAVRVSGDTARAVVYQDIEDLTAYHTHTLLAAPLKVSSNVVGVMEAVHTQPEAFSEDDLRILEAAASWAAIAIDNARQHEDLRRRLQESQAMAIISQTLTETLDLERIFQLIVDTAQQTILHAERAVIHLLDDQAHALHPVAVAGLTARSRPGFTMHPGEGIAGRVMAEGIVMNVPDITADPRYVSLGAQTDLRSLMVAPVQSGGRRLGTISVASAARHAFATNDERLLAHLGAQAAIAIEKARLYQAEREQRTLAVALRDTAAALTSTLDFGEIIDRVLANAGAVVPHDAADIMLIDQGVGRIVRCRGYAERAVEAWLLEQRFPVAQFPTLQEMMQTGQPLVVSNTSIFPGWIDLPGTQWIRSYVSAPICIKGQVAGFLELDSTTPGFFHEAHAAALKIFADQAAISIQNAQLYQAERQRLEKAVALQRVTRAVSSHLDLDELLRTIVAAVSEIANYEHVCVYFLEANGLQLMAQRGYQPGEAIELIPEGRGVVGRVIRIRCPTLVPDVQTDSDYIPTAPEARSAMAVPLTRGQELSGVLLVETSTERRLDQDDLDWLVGVGQQLSVALENARLYADLQNALRQEQAMRDQLVQADKLAAVGQMAASVAHELNNPLQAIQGCLDLAESHPNDPAKQRHYLVMAKGELDRLTAIVRRMLDYYRPAKGVREWVDVRVLISDVLALAGKRLAQGKVTVQTEWDKDLPAVHGIGNQLKQVFLNVILNAVDAMPQGGDLRIHARAVQEDDSKWVSISFQDTGVGIPPEDLKKIFEPFYTTRVTGTGLGLAVSHNIITHHRGQLTVHSVVGKGSTFTIRLPL